MSFRIDSDKVRVLDQLAQAFNRNRNDLLNEAVVAYLDVQHWQSKHLQASTRQADAREFVSHEEVKKMAAKWARRR